MLVVSFIHRRTYRWKGDNSKAFQGAGKLLALYADGSMNVYFVIILYLHLYVLFHFLYVCHCLYFLNGWFYFFVLALFLKKGKRHLRVAVFFLSFLNKKASFLSHFALSQRGSQMLVGDCCIYFLSAIFLALSVPDEPGENFNCLVTLKFKMLGINLNKHLSVTVIVYLFYILYVGHQNII